MNIFRPTQFYCVGQSTIDKSASSTVPTSILWHNYSTVATDRARSRSKSSNGIFRPTPNEAPQPIHHKRIRTTSYTAVHQWIQAWIVFHFLRRDVCDRGTRICSIICPKHPQPLFVQNTLNHRSGGITQNNGWLIACSMYEVIGFYYCSFPFICGSHD